MALIRAEGGIALAKATTWIEVESWVRCATYQGREIDRGRGHGIVKVGLRVAGRSPRQRSINVTQASRIGGGSVHYVRGIGTEAVR
ncbi:hypothetical protein ACLOJK_014892 [Asimina triloba]